MIFGKKKAILTNISEESPRPWRFSVECGQFHRTRSLYYIYHDGVRQNQKILWLCLNTDKCKNSMKTTTIFKIPSSQLMATATSWVIALDSFYSTYKIKGINVHSHKTPLLPESNQSRTDFISLKLLPNHLTQTHNV